MITATTAATNHINDEHSVPTPSTVGASIIDEPISLSISLPIVGHTLRSATNLFNLMYTWGSLISSATGGRFNVDKYLINVINRRKFESIDELLAYARTETEIHKVLAGLHVRQNKITFDGFKEIAAPENCGLYSRLIASINSAAMKTNVIQAKVLSDVQTEQWQSFSKWLRRIGMTNEDRLALLDLLSASVTDIPPEVQTGQASKHRDQE